MSTRIWNGEGPQYDTSQLAAPKALRNAARRKPNCSKREIAGSYHLRFFGVPISEGFAKDRLGEVMIAQEYVGSEGHQSIQRRMPARHAEIAADPALANGGRFLNVLDPDLYGWDCLVADVAQDRFVGLTAMKRETIFEQIEAVFGSDVETLSWDVFLGAAQADFKRCKDLVRAIPKGWIISSHPHPTPKMIGAVQSLNAACGVAPMPAWYMRGGTVPQITTCIHDPTGDLAACALVSDRYHVDGRLASTVFLGSVSVASHHRGAGLGVAVTAQAVIDIFEAYGWTQVLAQVAADNRRLRAILERCGLIQEPTLVTVGINASGTAVTR